MTSERPSLDALRIDRQDPARPGGRRWPWLAAILVLMLAGGGWWLTTRRPAEVTAAAVREESGGGSATVLDASGYVTARRQATVSSKVTGRVVEVRVEEGQHVVDGEVLARLDDTIPRAQLALARAQLDSARKALAETRVRLAQARLDLERTRRLAGEEVSSQADLDRDQAEVDSLAARLEAQDSDVGVAARTMALREREVEDAVIRAPFAGVVVSKNAQPGEMISPISAGGGFTRTGICTLVDMSSLEIEVDVSESYINRVEPGQPVVATLDAYPDWKIPARVITLVPAADRQKATVLVRIGFDQLDPRILPDMGIKVAFRQESEEAAGARLWVPAGALRREGDRTAVWVVEGGVVRRRAVTAGAERGDEVEVLSGLSAGERVVVDGPPDLEDGESVEEVRG
jgi:HlyD family secretion protein